ncbi:NAD(P)/FAD-dependent oxidoreductase [Variovorax sp. Sphag1AA]|uniref:NAD(P)/FAD-dependent oxidoreductase n=1 Tax=Variovorax sp. Sphag1AA TaxID=2587027 RepID=UPI001609BC78|nr:FAD-dependent oxidoreductase [Variovorax sp. Sphag1AA]MBB3181280.1 3-phenylpropionate/trans-cinnamate dioxygenase ferredoxin reductase subunit [Variovorax sp. Sphag1AA]
MNASPLVIVGASYAGTQLAASARELGFDAPIVMLGDERHAPYQRPPLSKGVLTGKTTLDSLPLRGADFFDVQGIDLRLGHRATALNTGAQTLTLDDGSILKYGTLALATGARCRPLPVTGSDLEGVFNLRTLDDALRVSDALSKATRACVIGGGFIGLEVASALAARGASVTVVESQPRLLARSFPPLMSEYLANAHRQRNVELVLGRGVRALSGASGRVEHVELDDGRRIDCDMVVLGIGVQPNVELAQQAGVACDNGILTDALGRTSAPNVIAVGDVANTEAPTTPGGPARMRLESIQAANDGARAAASALAGKPQPFEGVPWFWSDQHNLKLQMAGLAMPGDEVIARGDMQTDRFSLFYLREGAVVAAHSVNRPAEHMLSRKLIARRVRIDPQQLSDESFDLKTL